MSDSVLDRALGAAGFTRLQWQSPEESGYHQPVLLAQRP